MILFITKNIVKDYIIILFIIVLRIVTNSTIEAILSYTFTILNNIVILIVSKVLYNIIAIIK